MNNIVDRDHNSVWHPFTQHGSGETPIPISGGKGTWLSGNDGIGYLDMISSWWVNLHGHGRPELAKAISDQVMQLDHVQFAGSTHEPAVRLAERLLEKASLLGNAKVFYSDNGSTAIEVALKALHQYWINKGTPRKYFAALQGGYHGDTVGSMSIGKASGFFNAFTELLFDTIQLPVPNIWNDYANETGQEAALEKVRTILDLHGESLSGLIVEPLVQGAAGMRFHSASYLNALCKLFQERGIPIVFDEVMTGFGRTGTFFAMEQTSVKPDILCLSKGITGGILPLSVTIISDKIFEAFLGDDFSTALAHGHSYTANPIACAAALASLDLHEKTKSLDLVKRINTQLNVHMRKLSEHKLVTHARVLGGIAAFDLVGSEDQYGSSKGKQIAEFARKLGVMIRPLGNVIYLMPPYCITDDELEMASKVIYASLNQ